MRKIIRYFLIFSLLLTSFKIPVDAAVSYRNIKVGIAVAPGFRAQPNWRSEFEQRLAYVSRIFESEFKVRFVPVKWYEWSVATEREEPRVLMEDLMSRFPLTDVDIMIGLTSVKNDPKQSIRDPHTIGQARPLSGYLVLRYPMSRLFKVQEQTVLAHEIGHLFGAIHTNDPSDIMFPVMNKQLPSRFDRENDEIIMETRDIDFRKGVEALSKPAIQKLLGSYIKMVAQEQPFDFFYMLGVLYLSLGQNENAINAWKKASTILPSYPRIHYDLGMLYYKMGSTQAAVRELTQAVQGFRFASENREKMMALVALGDVYQSQKDYATAYNAYTRALALDPKNKAIKTNLAFLLMKTGHTENAIREFEALLFQDPENVKLLAHLGIAYYESKRFLESERYLNRALAKLKGGSPESAEVHNYLAKIFLRTKQTKKALTHFQIACTASPSLDCYKGLAQMYFELGQWDDCISTLATVLQAQKDDPDVYGTLGVAFLQKGNYEKAIPILREGLRYTTDNKKSALFYQNIGHILIQLQQYDFAEKEFLMAISKDWNNVDCHQGLAVAYLGMQRFPEARKEFENILRIDPKNQKAKEMIRKIDKVISQPIPMDFQIQGDISS
ncbi:MAG TPA: tetratricopeptide repeat protein [Candidatus Omnitrophota bacterium]|nr:tetratricopeptide repeat protein [Candidatus Omnitrophota bacterium]